MRDGMGTCAGAGVLLVQAALLVHVHCIRRSCWMSTLFVWVWRSFEILCDSKLPRRGTEAPGANAYNISRQSYIVRVFVCKCFYFAFRICISCFVLSCLVCAVFCSGLLLDTRFGLHFFLGSPDISYFISTDFDRNQLL